MSKKESNFKTPLNEFENLIAANPDVRYIDVMTADSCGILRGKRLPVAEAKKVYTTGVQIPQSTYLLDVEGDSENPGGYGYDDGDPDCTLMPVAGTTCLAPWSDMGLAQVLTRMHNDDGSLNQFDPRNIAERVVEKFKTLGYQINIAFELEFYLIENKLDRMGKPINLAASTIASLESAMQVYSFDDLDRNYGFFDDVYAACQVQGLPASVMNSEFSPSQYEINLRHITDPLVAADHCALLRRVIKGVAERHDMRATFMSKPFSELSGNGMHLHISLMDQAGNNLMMGETETGSPLMRHVIGGLLETIPDMFAIFSPNVNAYRRFVPDTYVPVNHSWGYNNRSVTVRIPAGDSTARRVEHRVAGADANPYLVLAAILGGVIHGIENSVDPGEPSPLKNVGTYIEDSWPRDLASALDTMGDSKFAKSLLSDHYIDVYCELKRSELEKYNRHISSQEYAWYL